MEDSEAWAEVLFEPLPLGRVTARSRVVVPPHSSAIGNLWGTEQEADQAIAYLKLRAESGVAWTTIPGRISNVLNPGFEPSGISAVVHGPFRQENYVRRVRRYVDAMHSAGALAATQLTMNGGYPHAPSASFAQPVNFLAPHVISEAEIGLLLEEYRFAASAAAEAGIDVVELHMNHEDLTHQFLSSRINTRADGYGGSLENRMRLAMEVLRLARQELGPERAVGVRMNLEDPRAYDLAEGIEIATRIERSGLVDFFHFVYGSTWGNPSYIQPHFYEPGEWSHLARSYSRTLSVPIVYTGLVNSPRRAAEIIESGEADMIGMARAHIADPQILVKARTGNEDQVRPCVGSNDCINRRYVDGLPFGCAVNPHTAREAEGIWAESARINQSVVVVGGGPAGLEFAALVAEAGAEVTLFEREDVLGGQLRLAAAAPSFGRYGDYLEWQTRRLNRLGVQLKTGNAVDQTMLDGLPDGASVVFATGATERLPRITGHDRPQVLGARDVLRGAQVGRRVAVIAQEDHMQPLAAAEHAAAAGAEVTIFYGSHTPAQLLGRYSIGAVMGRLDDLGVEIRTMSEAVEIDESCLTIEHVYSGRAEVVGPFDSVVLACGGESDDRLFQRAQTEGRLDAHVLGDAYAPRRLVFATRQALAIAELLSDRGAN